MSSALPSDTNTPTIHAKPLLYVVNAGQSDTEVVGDEQETLMVTSEAPRVSESVHTVTVDEGLFNQLTELSVRGSTSVSDILREALFVMRHPSVGPLIQLAREALLRSFSGSHVTTHVDETFDPDCNRQRDQFVLTVWTSAHVSADDTIARLDHFYDEWIPNHLDGEDLLLRFDVGIE